MTASGTEFSAKWIAVSDSMVKIEKLLDVYASRIPGGSRKATLAHVGDLAQVETKLNELVTFLEGK